jgi:hypothetical protein
MDEQTAIEINDAVTEALDSFERAKCLIKQYDPSWYENWKAGGCSMGGFVTMYNSLDEYDALDSVEEEEEEEEEE